MHYSAKKTLVWVSIRLATPLWMNLFINGYESVMLISFIISCTKTNHIFPIPAKLQIFKQKTRESTKEIKSLDIF